MPQCALPPGSLAWQTHARASGLLAAATGLSAGAELFAAAIGLSAGAELFGAAASCATKASVIAAITRARRSTSWLWRGPRQGSMSTDTPHKSGHRFLAEAKQHTQ